MSKEQIKEKKNIVFGKFSDHLSKEDKANAWKEIHASCLAVSVLQDKDWTYIRDTFWPNQRKNTMKKYDNARKTGTGGGVDAKLTPVDEKVLEITGKDSPAVVSLGVAETFESTVPVPAVSQCVQKPSKRKSSTGTNEAPQGKVFEMKRRKLALQIEHLRLLNYQVKLDCFQRETALSLPHDPLTISLVSKEGNKTDNNNNSNVMAECISEDELDHFCVEDEEY